MLLASRARVVALVGLAVAGGAVVVAALGPAGPAVGQSSPPIQAQIRVNSPGTLGPHGASVDVSVTASCAGIDSTSVQVIITEAVDGDLAYGFGSANVGCTGTSVTVQVLVVAQSGSPTGLPSTVPSQDFKKGPAIAAGLIQACTADGTCAIQQVEPTIKIRG